MANLPQDYNKIVDTDKLGHGTAINAAIDGFLQLGYDRFGTQTAGGLNWAYYAGSIRFGMTLVNIAEGTLLLTDDATNYIYATSAGAVAKNTTGTISPNYPIAEVTTAAGAITGYTDKRSFLNNDVALPAGNNKEVQFNDGGVFGADDNFLWDKANNRLGIGDFSTRTIEFPFHAIKNATLEIGVETNNDATAGPRYIGRKSRGTLTAQTQVLTGDQLSILGGKGYHDGSAYSGLVGYVSVQSAENFTSTAQGSKIVFAVTPTGSTSASIVEKVTINPNGNLLIGATTDGWKLLVTPVANATAGQTALFQDRTATTGSTKVVLKAGAGQSTNTIFELQDSSAVLYTSFSAGSFFTKSTIDQKTATIGGIATFASIQPANSGGSYITLAAGTGGTSARGYIGWTHNGSGADMLFVGESADALAIRAESTLDIGISTALKMQLTSTQLKLKTQLGIIETGASPQYYTFLQGGDQAGDLTYTLPTGYPASTGYVLSSTDAGVMSWVANGGGGGMTNPMTTTGDIIYSSDNSGTPERLGISTDGYILTLASGIPSWAANAAMTNPMSADGDIIIQSSGIPARLPKGTDGEYLKLVSGLPAWAAGGGGSSPLTEGSTNYEIYRTNYPVAGNTRGAGAVDFVYERSGATMVASGAHSGLLSGRDNTCAGIRSVICGGVNNTINTAYSGAGLYDGDSVIAGGYLNAISQYHLLCAIGGGSTNQITTASAYIQMCTIGGGYNNTISSGATANASYHTISGGTANAITGQYGSTIAGGNTNIISDYADYSTIGGGKDNSIGSSCAYACIPGGRSNTAGSYSFACGYDAHGSNLANCFTFADGTATTPARASAAIFGVAGGFKIRMNNAETFEFYYDGTNSLTHSSGAVLTTGGVWTDASSRTLKTKIAEIDNKEILKKLMTINPERWKYKTDMETNTEHIGLYSEDFYDTFKIGSRNGLGATDLCGVLWAAVQALKSEIDELKYSIANK